MLTIMRGRRAGTPSSCCPLRVDHHVDHQVSIIIITIIIIMIIIIFMITLVISIFFFWVLFIFIFIFLMFMVMIVSGEDVIAWDHVGVQVQEKIGSWCSIYSLCQEQKKNVSHTHTNPTPRPSPILHPATGDVSKQSHATSQRFAALRGRHARRKWDRVTSESFSELQVRRLPGALPSKPETAESVRSDTLMFKVQCFRWQAMKVQCFCVQRNMKTFVPSPPPTKP